jgi:hypothetical protein
LVSLAFQPKLQLPAFTAYVVSNVKEVKREENQLTLLSGKGRIMWGGRFSKTGPIEVHLDFEQASPKEGLQLEIFGPTSSKRIDVRSGQSSEIVIGKAGWHRFSLSFKNANSSSSARVRGLTLSGPATEGAQFNLKERLNAASVHIGYALPQGEEATWFYTEVKAVTDPIHTFYMACGFNRGYFGMQVNSPTERRIIFSVWDAGTEEVDRNKVPEEDKVLLLAKGEGVYASGFGNEGTGGHSHLKVNWKTSERQRFILKAAPVANRTRYSAWWFSPEQKSWKFIASFFAPKTQGQGLRGLHSFSENFWGDTGHLSRAAEFGPAWVVGKSGQWQNIATGRFTHDSTGGKDRFDYDLTKRGSRLLLQHGGFVGASPKLGTLVEADPAKSPPDVDLGALTKQESALIGPG